MIAIYDNGGKTADRYTVHLHGDVYYMSDNADMPNGVCMYGGTVQDGVIQNEHGCKIPIERVPNGVRRQIRYIQIRAT